MNYYAIIYKLHKREWYPTSKQVSKASRPDKERNSKRQSNANANATASLRHFQIKIQER